MDKINISYGECSQAAQLRNENCLGIQLQSDQSNKEKSFGVNLIPDKNQKFTITPDDGLITLAEDEA